MPVYLATLNGEHTALAIEAIAPDGYSGAIKIIVGIDQQGNILAHVFYLIKKPRSWR